MPRKPVRGRFSFKVPTTGGSYAVESDKDKSIDATNMVYWLRHYADFIERYFVKPLAAAGGVPPIQGDGSR